MPRPPRRRRKFPLQFSSAEETGPAPSMARFGLRKPTFVAFCAVHPLTWGSSPIKLFTAAECREIKAFGGIRTMKKLLTILVMFGVVTCPVFAGAITDLGLFNTGTSSDWQVGGVAATTATAIPGAWAPNTGTPQARRVGSRLRRTAMRMRSSTGPVQTAPSNYTLQFTVPSTYTLSSIVISGKWALDDFGTASIGGTVFSDQSTLVTHYSTDRV